MPKKPEPIDSYSPSEAGKVLGVTPRRIRQLAEKELLEATQWEPLRVSQVSVIARRSQYGVRTESNKANQKKQTPELKLLEQALEQLRASQELLMRQITSGQEAERIKEENYLRKIAELEAELASTKQAKRFWRK